MVKVVSDASAWTTGLFTRELWMSGVVVVLTACSEPTPPKGPPSASVPTIRSERSVSRDADKPVAADVGSDVTSGAVIPGTLLPAVIPATVAKANAEPIAQRANLVVTSDDGTTWWRDSQQVAVSRDAYRALAVSPDGSVVALQADTTITLASSVDGSVVSRLPLSGEPIWLDNRFLAVSDDHDVTVFDVEAPDVARTIVHDDAHKLLLAASPGSGRALLSVDDKTYELSGSAAARLLPVPGAASAQLSNDGQRAVWIEPKSGAVVVYSFASHSIERTIHVAAPAASQGPVSCVVSTDLDRMVVWTDETTEAYAEVYAVSTGAKIATSHIEGNVDDLVLSPDGKLLSVSMPAAGSLILDLSKDRVTFRVDRRGPSPIFLAGGREVLVASEGPKLDVRRSADGSRVRTIAHVGFANALAAPIVGAGVDALAHARAGAARRAQTLVAAMTAHVARGFVPLAGGRLAVIDLDHPSGDTALLASPVLGIEDLDDVALTADARIAVVGTTSTPNLFVYDLTRATVLHVLVASPKETNAFGVAIDSTGTRIAAANRPVVMDSATNDETISLWSVAHGSRSVTLHARDVEALAWSPDGRTLAWASAHSLCTWSGGGPRCFAADFSLDPPVLRYGTDGTLFVNEDKDLYTLDARRGALREKLTIDNGGDFALAPDLHHAYFVKYRSRAAIVAVDLDQGTTIWQFDGYPGDAKQPIDAHVTVSPDGTRILVAGSGQDSVYALDAATGKSLGVVALPGPVATF